MVPLAKGDIKRFDFDIICRSKSFFDFSIPTDNHQEF